MEGIRPQTVIGMDSGKKYSWGNAVDAQTGEVLKERKLTNDPESFRAFAEGLPRPIRLVMESTGTGRTSTKAGRSWWRRFSWLIP